VLDVDASTPEDRQPRCRAGRGVAALPEGCGSPGGYRLMLKRQHEGTRVSDPALVDAMLNWLGGPQELCLAVKSKPNNSKMRRRVLHPSE
jgi:hypothetical protein